MLRVFRIFLRGMGVFVGLLVLLFILLQFSVVQTFIAGKAVAYVSDMFGTRIELNRVSLSVRGSVTVEGIYLEDLNRDTLLYVGKLDLRIGTIALLRGIIDIGYLNVRDMRAFVHRSPEDSTFNFNFLVQNENDVGSETEITVSDEGASPSNFRIGKIRLDRIYVSYRDDVDSTYVSASLGYLYTTIKKVDPAQLQFIIDDLHIADLEASAELLKNITNDSSDNSDSASLPQIGFDNIALSNIHARYSTGSEGEQMGIGLDTLNIAANYIDITAGIIDLSSVQMSGASLLYHFREETIDRTEEHSEQTYPVASDPASEGLVWTLSLISLGISDSELQIRDLNRSDDPTGFDASNIFMTGIHINAEEIRFGPDKVEARINGIRLREQSGLELVHGTGNISIGDTYAEISDLRLETIASELAANIALQYPSLGEIGNNLHSVRINRFSVITDIDLNEVQKVFPGTLSGFPGNLPEQSRVGAELILTGSVADLTIEAIHIEAGNETVFKAHGIISGLPVTDSLVADLKIDEFSITDRYLQYLLPAGIVPENIKFPEFVNIAAELSGSLQKSEGSISLSTSYGDAGVRFGVTIPAEGDMSYSGVLKIHEFDVGALIRREEQFGQLTGQISAEGLGTDMNSMAATLSVDIESAEIVGYRYRNIEIIASADSGEVDGRISIEDEFIKFTAEAALWLTDAAPRYRFSFLIDEVFLHELNLAEGELYLHGRLNADITGASADSLNGYIRINDFRVIENGARYSLDSLLISMNSDADEQEITLTSHFLNGFYRGNVGLGDLTGEITHHINKYFPMHSYNGPEDTTSRHFEFELTLTDPTAIPDFLIPELESISPFTITGNYESDRNQIVITTEIPQIMYAGISIEQLQVSLESDQTDLRANLTLDKIGSHTFTVFYPDLSVTFSDGVINPRIRLRDADNEDKLVIEFGVTSIDTGYIVSIPSEGILLNGELWIPPGEQSIFIGDTAMYIGHLRLENGNRYIEATMTPEQDELQGLLITFGDFPIDAFTGNVVSPVETLQADVKGTLRISGTGDTSQYHADLRLERIHFESVTVGSLHVRAHSESQGEYFVNAGIIQNGGYAAVEGNIATREESVLLDLAVRLDRYDLSSVEPFTFGRLRNISGYLNGDMTVQGTAGEPIMNGSLRFSDVRFEAVPLNTSFGLRNESINFNNTEIQFPSFTLRDAGGNPAVIAGRINREGDNGIGFNLALRATDFILINTTREHNDLVYGRVAVNSDLRVRGVSDAPEISGSVELRRGTAFTIVLPESDLELVEREGIVTFAEIHSPEDLSSIVVSERDTIRSELRGLNVFVNVQVDPQTELTVYVDPRAGDHVMIRGGGNLSFGIDPSGFLSLAGRYEINDGAYQLSFYDVARRRFDIRRGSSIVWAGDPLDAEVDISAIYTIRTSPIYLVGDQVGDQERQQYRRQLPFQVYLNMQGKLLKPEISFTLDMPPDQRGAFGGVIYSRIQQLNEQETERNKQVFSLLILNRFLADNPFDIPEGGGFSSTARSSASKILTQQLNALSGRYIRGVDISFDVESYDDYTEEGTVGRTELHLQVSRRFLDDRIIVELGGNIDLEGERKRQSGLTDIAGDIAVEYLLTQDGRYRLRGFRKTEYHGLVDGEITSTGLSFVVTRDFNRFSELFRKPRILEPVGIEEHSGNER
jgi:translocation and assembly module TamB